MSRGSKEFSVEDFPRGRDPITSPKDAEDTAYKHDDDAALLLSPSSKFTDHIAILSRALIVQRDSRATP